MKKVVHYAELQVSTPKASVGHDDISYTKENLEQVRQYLNGQSVAVTLGSGGPVIGFTVPCDDEDNIKIQLLKFPSVKPKTKKSHALVSAEIKWKDPES